jgi:DNA-binding response OmpR family regulator
MTKHFSTIPVDGTLRAAAQIANSDRLRPLALVVDDDPLITSTLAAILNGSGLAVMTAHDGPSALDTARLIPPEILISDLVIPGMDGFELALQITAATSDCEVILFAGNTTGFNLGTLMRSLKRDFTILAKPVHPADLLDAVFALLTRRGIPAETPSAFKSPASDNFVTSRVTFGSWSTTTNVKHRLGPRPGTIT